MLTLYETRYTGWTVKHFHERWHTEHGGTRSYSWTKKTLQAAGHVARAPRRGAHRKKRPRKPLPGMMLHQDGSTHEWVSGCQWDLIVTLDDATTEIYSAFFVEEEGTLSSLRGLREVIETQGLFSSLYTDRGSHYWHTDEAGGRVDKTRLTQVHRALQQLGVTLIPAYSPEARGRSERAFRTLQDRLPKELALAGITEMVTANQYLARQFLPAYNQRFAVPAPEAGTAFIPWIGTHLAEILCVQDERVVAKDNTVRYQSLSLQIPQDPHRFHDVKVTAERRFGFGLSGLMLPRQYLQAVSTKHAHCEFRIQSEKRSADGTCDFRRPAYGNVGWTVKVIDYLVARVLQSS